MTNPNHTDTNSDLVERLRGDWPEILVEKHWMMDSDAIDKQREEAADRIEALEAEVERLRGAISWIEPPFVHENTPADELRSRIGFCIADMRAALEPKQ